MKKQTVLVLALSIAGSLSQAQLQFGVLSKATSTMVPTALSSQGSSNISASNQNDLLMVKEDAYIALETGVVSENLASVMEKMKSVDSMQAGLSDEQLLLVIIQTN